MSMRRPIGALVRVGLVSLGVGCGAAPAPGGAQTGAAAPAPEAPALPDRRAAGADEVAPAAGSSAGSSAAVGASGPARPAPSEGARPEPPPIPPNTAVLHIGDSFALAGFAQALKPRLKALGARYEVKSEQSSYTVSWAHRMELIVANTQPDLVIISLGANEIANINPPAHAPAVRHIVKSIGGRPCVWVAPPLWRKDTGIIDVIRVNSAPCRFFDSDTLVPQPIPRQADKIHPNEEGGALWADAFWRWLEVERAREGEPDATGKRGPGRSPWALRPAPAEEHLPRTASK
ncbi:MAG TPA: SGNH/GDSL hydrolase family protein [Candidatus Nanopelagicales bacterium]|nr:SGNH/GDSL hydrolase family protein [Candidatus Nanopelagicales bacterium]